MSNLMTRPNLPPVIAPSIHASPELMAHIEYERARISAVVPVAQSARASGGEIDCPRELHPLFLPDDEYGPVAVAVAFRRKAERVLAGVLPEAHFYADYLDPTFDARASSSLIETWMIRQCAGDKTACVEESDVDPSVFSVTLHEAKIVAHAVSAKSRLPLATGMWADNYRRLQAISDLIDPDRAAAGAYYRIVNPSAQPA